MFSVRRVVLLLLFLGFFLASLFDNIGYWYCENCGVRLPCDESRVVRTMLWKEHEGLWARGGFIAHGYDPTPKGCYRTREDYQALQAQEWVELKVDLEALPVYISQPGWGTLLLYPFWRASQLIASDHKDRLTIGVWTLRAVSSLSTALALWLLCLWIVRETSLFSGLFVGLGMMLLPQMSTLLYTMGNSPLYKPFFHFLPFLMVAFALQSRWRKRSSLHFALPVVAGLAGIGIVAKVLFGLGYDMLPPVMVSATIPVFWYAVRERWSLRQFSLWFGFCSLAVLAGVAVGFVIHGLLVEAIGKDFLDYAKHRFLYRSVGTNQTLNTLRCNDADIFPTLSWAKRMACKSHYTVVLESFRYQRSFLVFCALGFLFCLFPSFVRAELKKRFKDPRFLALFSASVVCVGIGAVAAISQPLVWKQATAIHYWLSVSCWLLMFRPFALLTLSLLLEPALLRWHAIVLERWRRGIKIS